MNQQIIDLIKNHKVQGYSPQQSYATLHFNLYLTIKLLYLFSRLQGRYLKDSITADSN